MKASLRWLREICPQLPDDAKAIAERLTSAGLEVEATEAFGLGAERCVVASVLAVRPHPSRSGLRLVTLNTGGASQEVVCGAPNVPDAGGLVVFAPLGAQLPAKGMTVERRSIAGVVSEGMLCSEAELGLGDSGDGILVLPAGAARPGARLADVLPAARDTILDISLTPNRPDGLGHFGLAREAAALFGLPFVVPPPQEPERTRDDDISNYVALTVEDAEGCPHYAGAVLVDVRVGPSPLEVRWTLASLGVRPISNVVDVTNLVMLEFGHPTHAFDLDRVRGRSIVVRRARAGESLRTLDGVTRVLADDDLVVCDAVGPLALAGVMGGSESEITRDTERVLLECAYFDGRAVRRSARRHGLHTEASHRFERGVDWGDTRLVLSRAVFLVSKLAGAVFVPSVRMVDAKALARRTVSLRHARLRSLLGVDIEAADARGVLERLGFSSRSSQEDRDLWEVPSFRPDVAREVDLIEEVGRARGYDAIPALLPRVRASRDAGPRQRFARRAREAAMAAGLSEALTYSFVTPRDLANVYAPEAVVTLQNPLTEDRTVLRTSLLPGLLQAAAHARRHGQRDARLFAVGPVFLSNGATQSAASADFLLPEEQLRLTAVLFGERAGWLSKPDATDVWDAKGVAEDLCTRILRRAMEVGAASASERPPALHPRGAAWVLIDRKRVGWFGLAHPDVMEAFDLGGPLVLVDLNLSAMAQLGTEAVRFSPLPRFPASSRDLAVVVPDGVPAGDVVRVVREAAGDLAEQVALFDRFTGGGLLTGYASLALHVVYRAADRTLTEAEVDARHAQVVAAVEKRFEATLRA